MNPDYSQNLIPQVKTLKQRIMRRIYFVFLLRNTAPLAFDCLILVVSAFVVTVFVSVKDVWANLSVARAGGGIAGFSLSAFTDTELQTKFLLLALGVVGFFAVRDLKRAVRAIRTLRADARSAQSEKK